MSKYEVKTKQLAERLNSLPTEQRKHLLEAVAEYLIAEGRSDQLEWLLCGDENGYEALAAPVLDAKEASEYAPNHALAYREPSSSEELFGENRQPREGLPLDQILCGDNLALIREIPSESVQLVITSPPYFQQRDYGAGVGGEARFEDYLAHLMTLFRECVRVVKEEGSIVFNLGDKYIESSLLLAPYRFAIAATETGLVRLVNNVTWVKMNPTPRQFQRRLVSSAEPFFHFVKSGAYFYNLQAFMAQEQASKKTNGATSNLGKRYFELIGQSDLPEESKIKAKHALTDVIREVKQGEIAGFRMKIRGIHSEPFGGQEGGRKIQLEKNGFTIIRIHGNKLKRDVIETPVESVKGCKHPAIYPVGIVEEFLHLLTRPGDVVLDPYMGSGSTAVACKQLGRRYIGYDINPEYCEDARARVAARERSPQTLFTDFDVNTDIKTVHLQRWAELLPNVGG